ncbi:MAG: proprotein convertase P-domain-containing protein, partial [Bacteroidia bacterium]|nr:proprotein convertase P-domain-containing protein [Bacteroidia bacterium]
MIGTPAAEDSCQNAVNVIDGEVYLTTNVGSTPDKDLCSGSTETNVWFKWTVPATWILGDSAFVHLFNQQCDVANGMQMSVFDADNCGLIPDPAGAGDCVFFANTSTTADIFFAWVPDAIGNVYYFDLDGFGGTFCNFNFMINNTACLTLASKGSVDASCGINDGTAIVTAQNSDAPYTFSWSTTGTVTNNDSISINDGLAPGIYTFTITDANDCKIWDTLRVFPPVFADWTFSGDSCFLTNSINFEHVGSDDECGGPCPTFYWGYGDGNNSSTEDPTYTYLAAGTYSVTHIVDDGTCQDTVIKPVTIIDCTCPLLVGAGVDDTLCFGQTKVLQGSYSLETVGTSNTTVVGTSTGPIADNSSTSYTQTVGVTGTLNEVCVDITHTWDADVTIRIVDPCGNSVELTSGNGGGANDYSVTCFNDSAAVNIVSGTPPFNGTYSPENAISALDPSTTGCSSAGDWVLTILDIAMWDTGTLNSWDLRFGSAGTPPTVVWNPATNL